MQNDTKRLSVDKDTHTCERCAPVNFQNLANIPQGPHELLFRIDDLSQPLKDPYCPTCQILQTAVDVHRSQYTSAHVYWKRAMHAQGFMGTLEFSYFKGNTGELLMPLLTVYDNTAVPRTPKRQHPSKRVDFEQAKTWIDACKESHPDCTARSSKMLKGLRVIDCVTRSVIPAPQDSVYVALSYVWGMSGTYEAPGSSALLDQLPLTVDNSVDATLRLGYRYLWVDRYCIDQTSAVDKHDQINQMGDIYSAAELTLIAAAGENSEYGLPGVVCDRKHFGHDVTIGRLRSVTTYQWDLKEIDHSVWSSRAWTFQEGYMSRRRLYFTDTRLIYVCDNENGVYCDAETGSRSRWAYLGALSSSLPDGGRTVDLVDDILREYTRRKLTFDSDALNGIVGVLNTLSRAERPIFHTWGATFGGSPLVIALHWCHFRPCHRRNAVPSWSPLGWEGVVGYHSSAPVISPAFQVNVWDHSGFIQLSKVEQGLQQQRDAESLERSRYLQITAKLGWVEARYLFASEFLSTDGLIPIARRRTQKVDTPLPGFYVRVWDDDDTVEMYARNPPHWDLEPDPSSGTIRVLCAIIPQGHLGGHTVDDARIMVVIMLRNHGAHYERIGYFRYPHVRLGKGLISRDQEGTFEVRDSGRMSIFYTDEQLSRDFNDPEMQTFLLG